MFQQVKSHHEDNRIIVITSWQIVVNNIFIRKQIWNVFEIMLMHSVLNLLFDFVHEQSRNNLYVRTTCLPENNWYRIFFLIWFGLNTNFCILYFVADFPCFEWVPPHSCRDYFGQNAKGADQLTRRRNTLYPHLGLRKHHWGIRDQPAEKEGNGQNMWWG